jgi:hypothetical protein
LCAHTTVDCSFSVLSIAGKEWVSKAAREVKEQKEEKKEEEEEKEETDQDRKTRLLRIQPAFMNACAKGNVEEVKRCIQAGADLKLTDSTYVLTKSVLDLFSRFVFVFGRRLGDTC